MIPLAQITQWRNIAPWPDDVQVEQDLILSRILVEIFSNSFLQKELAFRGGTALHKLFLDSMARYSEDIDLVRTSAGPISNVIDSIRAHIDPLLGDAKTERTNDGFRLKYFFNPENSPNIKQRIKIEINTRENFSCFKRLMKQFTVQSDWFSGNAYINTYQFEELIATKLRALYQRKKGRDVFDLWLALKRDNLNVERIIAAFEYYMQKEGNIITRKMFIKNLEEKLQNNSFINDIGPLLSPDLKKTQSRFMVTEETNFITTEDGDFITTEGWSIKEAAKEIKEKILIHLPSTEKRVLA